MDIEDFENFDIDTIIWESQPSDSEVAASGLPDFTTWSASDWENPDNTFYARLAHQALVFTEVKKVRDILGARAAKRYLKGSAERWKRAESISSRTRSKTRQGFRPKHISPLVFLPISSPAARPNPSTAQQ